MRARSCRTSSTSRSALEPSKPLSMPWAGQVSPYPDLRPTDEPRALESLAPHRPQRATGMIGSRLHRDAGAAAGLVFVALLVAAYLSAPQMPVAGTPAETLVAYVNA